MTVLIVTMPGDVHARAVHWAIEKMGGTAAMFYPADLSNGAQWTFEPSRIEFSIEYLSLKEKINFSEYRTIWMRRPTIMIPQESMSDIIEKAITEDDFATFAHSIYLLLEHGRFAVNRFDDTRRAGLKPYQLTIAKEAGLNIPRTLIGNCPEDIFRFYHKCNGDIIFKPFKSPLWQAVDGQKIVPTTRISLATLQDSDLAAAPGIFQEHIVKYSEVRATIMGSTIFAWEKRFDGRDDLDVDWRFMFKDAKYLLHKLPENVELACFSLMDRLGLVFGCFDFIIDREGNYIFLEVNPQGQWLWGDTLEINLNQLEAMAEFLISANPKFRYTERNLLRLSDCPKDILDPENLSSEEKHYGHLRKFNYYRYLFRMNSSPMKKSI